MANAFYRLWGLNRGPISHFPLSPALTTAVQLFDSSNAARTPDESTKTIVINNLASSTGDVYVGFSTVTNTSFLTVISPGSKEVFDATWASLPNFHVYVTAAATLSVGQAG